jgi:AcrR family transcriptional regulator
MPSTRAETRRLPADVRREQILDAAERVLLERGLAATTVADVADAAGIAKGTVYLQFASKNDVIAALRARYLERFVAAFGSATRDRTATKRMRHITQALYDFSVEHHELHHLLFHESGFSEADAFASARRAITEVIREGKANDEFTVDNVAATAAFILHGLHGLLVESLHDGTPRKQALRYADALVLRALGAA